MLPYITIIVVALIAVFSVGILCRGKKEQFQCNNTRESTCERKCRYVQDLRFWVTVIIAIVCCVAFLTISMAADASAFNMFSFASTVSSVILSVIAIFMTISGENASSTTKDKVDLTVGRLDSAIKEINKQRTDYEQLLLKFEAQIRREEETFGEVLSATKNIQSSMEQLSESVKIKAGTTYSNFDKKQQYKNSSRVFISSEGAGDTENG